MAKVEKYCRFFALSLLLQSGGKHRTQFALYIGVAGVMLLKIFNIMRTNNNNQAANYGTFVLATNKALKEEFATLTGAVKILAGMDNLPTEVARALRMYAGGKPATSNAGRTSIAKAVAEFAKGGADSITRKATAKERATGAPERVTRDRFTPFWVLQQLYKMVKA